MTKCIVWVQVSLFYWIAIKGDYDHGYWCWRCFKCGESKSKAQDKYLLQLLVLQAAGREHPPAHIWQVGGWEKVGQAAICPNVVTRISDVAKEVALSNTAHPPCWRAYLFMGVYPYLPPPARCTGGQVTQACISPFCRDKLGEESMWTITLGMH